jgi:transglutaminase-like putative cysteine protease
VPISGYRDGIGNWCNLLRALDIPARYCTGYLEVIGLPPPYAPMDFAAWLEVHLGCAWHTFDPRNSVRRRGRILIARGRDASGRRHRDDLRPL